MTFIVKKKKKRLILGGSWVQGVWELTREMRNKGAVGRDRRDDSLGTGKE